MPGGSSCQLGLLQQHHILHATLGQVIGHAGPHTPTPDDDSVRAVFPPLSQSRGCITGRKEDWSHVKHALRKGAFSPPDRTPHLSSARFLAEQPIVLTGAPIGPRQAAKSLRK